MKLITFIEILKRYYIYKWCLSQLYIKKVLTFICNTYIIISVIGKKKRGKKDYEWW